jgi:hypothetical protein
VNSRQLARAYYVHGLNARACALLVLTIMQHGSVSFKMLYDTLTLSELAVPCTFTARCMVEAEGLIIPVVHLDHECGLHLTVLLCCTRVYARSLIIPIVCMNLFLHQVLSDNNAHATAVQVATQTTQPAWGYWASLNATTCWESWDGGASHNHIFLCGGIGEWQWKFVVGVAPTSPAWETILVQPRVDCDRGPRRATAELLTPYGTLRVSWTAMDGVGTSLNVTIPVGVVANVVVPKPMCGGGVGSSVGADQTSADVIIVKESGETVWTSEQPKKLKGSGAPTTLKAVAGVSDAHDTYDAVAFTVQSGTYAFAASRV